MVATMARTRQETNDRERWTALTSWMTSNLPVSCSISHRDIDGLDPLTHEGCRRVISETVAELAERGEVFVWLQTQEDAAFTEDRMAPIVVFWSTRDAGNLNEGSLLALAEEARRHHLEVSFVSVAMDHNGRPALLIESEVL